LLVSLLTGSLLSVEQRFLVRAGNRQTVNFAQS